MQQMTCACPYGRPRRCRCACCARGGFGEASSGVSFTEAAVVGVGVLGVGFLLWLRYR